MIEDLDQFVRLMKDAKRQKMKSLINVKSQASRNSKEIILVVSHMSWQRPMKASTKNNCSNYARNWNDNQLRKGSEQYEPAVGAFVADEEIWPYLVAAENPAHSEWSETARRLQQDFPEFGKELIASLNNS